MWLQLDAKEVTLFIQWQDPIQSRHILLPAYSIQCDFYGYKMKIFSIKLGYFLVFAQTWIVGTPIIHDLSKNKKNNVSLWPIFFLLIVFAALKGTHFYTDTCKPSSMLSRGSNDVSRLHRCISMIKYQLIEGKFAVDVDGLGCPVKGTPSWFVRNVVCFIGRILFLPSK